MFIPTDKQDYDNLLAKYNDLVAEQDTQPLAPVATLVHRAMESSTPTFVYTTTTVTQGTTITIQTTASSSSLPDSSEQCTAGTPETVTVTVTAEGSSSAPSYSTPGPVTVLETRVTTATIFVTASGLVTPKAETLTVTATATELKTSTEVATVNGGSTTLTGTSTSTAEGIWGTSAPASSHRHTHFPNTTTILSPYDTTGFGGAVTSTASYTLTVPPGVTGAIGSTGKLTTPLGTTTSQVDPVSTVVTVSGASKVAGVSIGMVIAAIFVAALHI